MKEPFETVLSMLGGELSLDLYQDKHGVCELALIEGIHVQLAYEMDPERLCFSSFVAHLGPGPYRERVLKSALIYNGKADRIGTFAFCTQKNQIVFFSYLYPPFSSSYVLVETLKHMTTLVLTWKEAIEKSLPLPEMEEGPAPEKPPFRTSS